MVTKATENKEIYAVRVSDKVLSKIFTRCFVVFTLEFHIIEWMFCTVICGTQMVKCAIISEDFGTKLDSQDLFWI